MKFNSIDRLPGFINQDDAAGGVLRPWVRALPLRHQGVIITAMRGCDTAPKEDASKSLTAMIRRATMNPYDPRESLKHRGFFGFDPLRLGQDLEDFLHSLDQYPLHYIMHLMHACQVIGYKSPEYGGAVAEFFEEVYLAMVRKFHLRHEGSLQMDSRLTEDRVLKGTVERDL